MLSIRTKERDRLLASVLACLVLFVATIQAVDAQPRGAVENAPETPADDYVILWRRVPNNFHSRQLPESDIRQSSSTFTSDKVRPLSTAELMYSLMDTTGVSLSVGYWAKTTAKDTMKVKTLSFNDAHGIFGKGKPATTNAGSNSQSGR